jgi:hypothetical protein
MVREFSFAVQSSAFDNQDFSVVVRFGLKRRAGQGGDPFDFAQGRLFAAPEKRLRSG